MEETQSLGVLNQWLAEKHAEANGQQVLPEETKPSMNDMQLAMERFNAAREARSGAMRHRSSWILGNQ